MSQSPNSTKNTNIFSDLSTITVTNKEIKTVYERAPKRAAHGQVEDQVKKAKIDHHPPTEHVSSAVPKCLDQPKFISAAEMAANNACTNIQIMPEISDEEFLEMAIKFEIEHPE